MWPYDYSRENESPLLWVSEGFTNYYGSLALYRAGLRTTQQFLQSVEGAINGVENNEARSYISPANSSVSTWVGYDTPVAFGISYYTQGQNLGALLDLSILHDTAGASRLDDVMRALYRQFYLQRRGFTTDDMIAIVNRLTRHDYHDFYRRYVFGVEVPAYEKILGYAGYKVENSSGATWEFGMEVDETPEGMKVIRVDRSGTAYKAGLRVGDILVSVDELDIQKNRDAVFARMQQRIGGDVKLAIKRANSDQVVDLHVGSRKEANYKITEMPDPTPEQLKIRERWLQVAH